MSLPVMEPLEATDQGKESLTATISTTRLLWPCVATATRWAELGGTSVVFQPVTGTEFARLWVLYGSPDLGSKRRVALGFVIWVWIYGDVGRTMTERFIFIERKSLFSRTMTRTDLYTLIDTLPESKLPVARAYLEGLRDGADSEKERFMVEVQIGLDELDRGESLSHEEVMESLKPWLEG